MSARRWVRPEARSQSGVYVHEDDHDQVQDGPDDPQHRQDALLLALLLLASSVFIIAARDDHLGCQCLYLPPQANLQLERGSREIMVDGHPPHSRAHLLGVGFHGQGLDHGWEEQKPMGPVLGLAALGRGERAECGLAMSRMSIRARQREISPGVWPGHLPLY